VNITFIDFFFFSLMKKWAKLEALDSLMNQ